MVAERSMNSKANTLMLNAHARRGRDEAVRAAMRAIVLAFAIASGCMLTACSDATTTPKVLPSPAPVLTPKVPDQSTQPSPAQPTSPQSTPNPLIVPPPTPEKSSQTGANPTLERTKITIDGTDFDLELAVTDETRFHGLSERTEIAERGGMIFVFPRASITHFVMRDCPIAIDIIFLNAGGRITAMHAMQPETPRTEAEKVNIAPGLGAPSWTWTNPDYESRLKKYPSKFSAQFAIELKGGTLAKMKLKEGQLIEFDRAALIAKTK